MNGFVAIPGPVVKKCTALCSLVSKTYTIWFSPLFQDQFYACFDATTSGRGGSHSPGPAAPKVFTDQFDEFVYKSKHIGQASKRSSFYLPGENSRTCTNSRSHRGGQKYYTFPLAGVHVE